VKKHILIVEDEEHLADALSHNLQFEGYATTLAFDGEEGLRAAQAIQFDLVILDIMLPKLDGLELCRRLRATGNRVPILFLTADTAQIEGLRENGPLGIHSPEAMRIPGLLLLPDGAGAGERFEGVFAHEDLLDLLYLLVSPGDAPAPRKFLERHRVVSVGLGGGLAASAGHLCVESPLRCYGVEGRWHLRPLTPSATPRLLAALRQFAADDAALWPAPLAPR